LTLVNLNKSFDNYSRIARVYPGVVFLAPLLWYVALFAPELDLNWSSRALFAVGVMCALYVLASFVRWRGKIAETKLLRTWGAWVTTMMLRHRDTTIDAHSKARYHNALSAMCSFEMPSKEEEDVDPMGADEKYRSATKFLTEQRRDPKYKILHYENASYGFRRNLYGLRGHAIAFGLVLILITVCVWCLLSISGLNDIGNMLADVKASPKWIIAIILDLFYIIFFGVIPNTNFVFQAAREYGEALFKTIDAP
jgi:hypothetical protein